MKAAKYICTYSDQKNGLANSADQGCAPTARPPASRNPVGWFIQALTAMTNIEPVIPASAIGRPLAKCSRGRKRSQPYT